MSLKFQVDEVHGKCKFIGVQHSVAVNVRQFPDLSKDRVVKFGLG